MEFKGLAINKSPLFKGKKYGIWKIRTNEFIKLTYIKLMKVINKGIFTLFDTYGNWLPQESSNEEQRSRY